MSWIGGMTGGFATCGRVMGGSEGGPTSSGIIMGSALGCMEPEPVRDCEGCGMRGAGMPLILRSSWCGDPAAASDVFASAVIACAYSTVAAGGRVPAARRLRVSGADAMKGIRGRG